MSTTCRDHTTAARDIRFFDIGEEKAIAEHAGLTPAVPAAASLSENVHTLLQWIFRTSTPAVFPHLQRSEHMVQHKAGNFVSFICRLYPYWLTALRLMHLGTAKQCRTRLVPAPTWMTTALRSNNKAAEDLIPQFSRYGILNFDFD